MDSPKNTRLATFRNGFGTMLEALTVGTAGHSPSVVPIPLGMPFLAQRLHFGQPRGTASDAPTGSLHPPQKTSQRHPTSQQPDLPPHRRHHGPPQQAAQQVFCYPWSSCTHRAVKGYRCVCGPVGGCVWPVCSQPQACMMALCVYVCVVWWRTSLWGTHVGPLCEVVCGPCVMGALFIAPASHVVYMWAHTHRRMGPHSGL